MTGKMKGALAALVLAFFAAAFAAQAADVPKGSYQKTCKNIKMSVNGMRALCQKRDGSWKETSLSSQVFPCREIENDDGNLVCLNW